MVYRIGEGWEPICKFLGKPIPKEPFPHMNRLGSVIKELSEHPDYIRTMKRQLIAWIIRLTLISGEPPEVTFAFEKDTVALAN